MRLASRSIQRRLPNLTPDRIDGSSFFVKSQSAVLFFSNSQVFFHHHNLIGGSQLNNKVPEGHNVPYCPEIYTVFVAVKIEQFNSARQ